MNLYYSLLTQSIYSTYQGNAPRLTVSQFSLINCHYCMQNHVTAHHHGLMSDPRQPKNLLILRKKNLEYNIPNLNRQKWSENLDVTTEQRHFLIKIMSLVLFLSFNLFVCPFFFLSFLHSYILVSDF